MFPSPRDEVVHSLHSRTLHCGDMANALNWALEKVAVSDVYLQRSIWAYFQ